MVKYDDKTVAQWCSERTCQAGLLLSIRRYTAKTVRNVRKDLGLYQLHRCGSGR